MKKSSVPFYALIFTLVIMFMTSIDGYSQPLTGKAKYRDFNFNQFKLLPSPPVPQLDVPYSVIKQDFTITLRDNVIMDCAKFYPSTPNPYLPNGYPTVIMVHGYGDRKETLEGFASAQAQYNYVVYTYSVRGQGNSGGLSNMISTTEAQDLIELVNFIHTDFSTGLDTANILIMGGSQGGTVPYIAACLGGLKVKTIISAVSSPEFATSWIENGCIKMTLLWTVEYTPDTARYAPQVERMSDWIYSNAKDKWDSLAKWLPFNRDFKNIVSQNRIPIMLENCWQDKFFNAYGNISTIPLLQSDKRYYFGAVMGHGGDTSWTEDQWHMNFFNEWFYHYLWGMDQGLNTRPKFHYASTTFPTNSIGMWSFKHDSSSVWPPVGVSDLKLYFNSNSRLKTTPNTNSSSYVTLNNTVSSGYTMEQAVNSEFTGTTFTNKFKKASITFNSDPLTQNMQIVGTPSIKLDYYSNVNLCQFNFQIYEVQGTVAKLVNRINYTDRAYTSKTRKNKLINGISHSHIFKAGSRIRVVVTNLDKTPDDTAFLGTNPFVLPVMTSGAHRLYLSSNSYLNLPMKSPVSSKIAIFAPEQNETGVTDGVFTLNQNYPNPFNPVTNISFSIPKEYSGIVSLKVYDVAGKEVSSLVNQVMSNNSGIYNLTFDGSKLASGVYFYKLTAGGFSDIKKMILIK
ncbi:MAG: T9SS type A sorting domain-containing protein [Ignavibacteriae bacterium]|nr:T9SS type A sorting domain-containing protein [Ignavibacteriota bacterium]